MKPDPQLRKELDLKEVKQGITLITPPPGLFLNFQDLHDAEMNTLVLCPCLDFLYSDYACGLKGSDEEIKLPCKARVHSEML